MQTNERRMMHDKRQSTPVESVAGVFRWLRAICVLICVLSIFGACSAASEQPAQEVDDPAGGSRFGPQVLAENFLKDLRDALHDSKLGDDTTRSRWAEKLANYFAPNERDDQRVALNASLASFAEGQTKLDVGQTLSLDLRFTSVQKIADDGERALVRPVNGGNNASIYLLIARTNDRGAIVPEFEQEIGFDKIFGRDDGAIPAVRIGDRWYLTEG
ncbi:MAG TPA: hypothetical protein VFX76_15330 [Roseiflexaceae bacterium]|nr:hypothetical protein [Roseiflexaceae bacterium]